MARRIGVLGGTFDPIHMAHLVMAERAREQLRLDLVLLVPAYLPPHKQQETISDAKQRFEMVRLAVAGVTGLQASDVELRRRGVSYTVETLRGLHAQSPEDELILLLGADSVLGLPEWREPEEIVRLARLAPVRRPGVPLEVEALAPYLSPAERDDLQARTVAMPLLEVSSSDLRARVAAGLSIRFLVPPAVQAYIQAQGLYRA